MTQIGDDTNDEASHVVIQPTVTQPSYENGIVSPTIPQQGHWHEFEGLTILLL